jgi:hypothetical protein
MKETDMKPHVRLILSGACMLVLVFVRAQAQDQDEMKRKIIAEKAAAEVNTQIAGEMFKVLMPKFGFEAKLVKGAPYSATVESGTVQTLADGNRITKKSTATVYRDGEGRTRRENSVNAQGVATEVFINDPVAGANYVFDTQTRVAVKSPAVNLMKADLDALKVKMVRAQEMSQEMKPEAREKLQMQMKEEVERVQVKERAAQEAGKAAKKPKPVTESLGKQMIEGVECEGTRTTITLPAGLVGNDLPINIVSEEWYSPELQVLVLTRQNDPRTGETTYRLTNVNRGEPDHSLFEVPGDYTIKNDSLYKVKLDKKPEEQE